jgi:hypothetical protein
MYCVYGGHRHPDNEVNLVNFEVIPQYSERGTKYASLHRVHLQGELIYTGQENLSNAISGLINGYADNNQTFCMYRDDGTQTPHRLIQDHDDNLSGVKVVHRSWPKGDPAEYATTRTFSIVLQALYRDVESEILECRETLQFIGDGGPKWEWVKSPLGSHYQQTIFTGDTQKIIQSGRKVGLSGWPTKFEPILPTWEHRELRQIRMMEPIFAGRQYRNYGIAWTYVMEPPPGISATPNLYYD